jgi:dTMP kinase
VEKETGLASERPRIAGVFVTRLRRNMRLQTDPTVIYGMGEAYDGNIRKRDLQTDTPYNTYTRAGLPPTPIALPSREAIDAVVQPLETGDIFFVATGPWRRIARVLGDTRGAQCRHRTLTCTAKRQQDPMTQARFITLEGIEGAGKTTVADRITQSLRARGIKVHATREPGGTKVAERIRALVLDRGEEHISPTAETLLMFGARQVHVDNLIRPTLARGEWVLCDRFTDATHAYQGGGRGVDRRLIDHLAQAVHGDLTADCTLLLDVPVRVGLERMQARRGAVRPLSKSNRQYFLNGCAIATWSWRERIRRAFASSTPRSSSRTSATRRWRRSRQHWGSNRCARDESCRRCPTGSIQPARKSGRRWPQAGWHTASSFTRTAVQAGWHSLAGSRSARTVAMRTGHPAANARSASGSRRTSIRMSRACRPKKVRTTSSLSRFVI